jgi:hypothetical protein
MLAKPFLYVLAQRLPIFLGSGFSSFERSPAHTEIHSHLDFVGGKAESLTDFTPHAELLFRVGTGFLFLYER